MMLRPPLLFAVCQRSLAPLVVALLTLLSGAAATAASPVVVELVTSRGTIRLELDAEKAPRSVDNFVQYVRAGHYNGTIFHRVIPGYLIQGGGLTQELHERVTQPPIRNEAGNGLSNRKYAVAFARMQDAHSATSQFFINLDDNPSLDKDFATQQAGYAVFGRVVAGHDVVKEIAAVRTVSQPDPVRRGVLLSDVPVEPMVITRATIVSGVR